MAQNYSDAPPPYSASDAGAAAGSSASGPSRLRHTTRNGIPPQARRSMEDERRSLPPGWVRQYDPQSQHQFFVDTNAKPPRSIWHHPYDDEQYLSTLPSDERERIQAHHRAPSVADLMAESTDEEDDYDEKHPRQGKTATAAVGAAGASRTSAAPHDTDKGKKKETLGQRMKDKLTGTTHDEREKERQKRADEEQRAYEQHLKIRQAMNRAMETGQPQLIGKDKESHDVYIEPPNGPGAGYNVRAGTSQQNPYTGGPYQNPNARFIRPDYEYSRPYGYGYGGGYGYGYGGYGGLGMGMPLMYGLGGGLLLGGMMGGLGGFII